MWRCQNKIGASMACVKAAILVALTFRIFRYIYNISDTWPNREEWAGTQRTLYQTWRARLLLSLLLETRTMAIFISYSQPSFRDSPAKRVFKTRKLQQHGMRVLPINPQPKDVRGRPCFPEPLLEFRCSKPRDRRIA